VASSYLELLADGPLLRRALRPAVSFATVAALGIAGYVALADVGFVDAAFWLLDPTSIELHFQTHDGPAALTKAYAIVVTVGLVLSSIWAGETVLSAAFGGQIRGELRNARERRRIMDTTEHVIICGYGMFGRTIARNLSTNGRPIVVVEYDEAVAATAREDGHLVVTGDSRQESVLREAGVDEATSLVAAVDDSNVNVQVAITASQLAPTVSITVRVGSEEYETLARRAGADHVIIPEVISGEDVAEGL